MRSDPFISRSLLTPHLNTLLQITSFFHPASTLALSFALPPLIFSYLHKPLHPISFTHLTLTLLAPYSTPTELMHPTSASSFKHTHSIFSSHLHVTLFLQPLPPRPWHTNSLLPNHCFFYPSISLLPLSPLHCFVTHFSWQCRFASQLSCLALFMWRVFIGADPIPLPSHFSLLDASPRKQRVSVHPFFLFFIYSTF